jgi:hypothetical protein
MAALSPPVVPSSIEERDSMHAQLLDGHGLEIPSSGTIVGAFNNCNQPFAAPFMPMLSSMHVISHDFFA